MPKKARVCLDPRTSWKDRRIVLADTLALAAERRSGDFIALADIDALAPIGTEDWSADRSIAMRRELYALVLDAIQRGGWIVYRPCPARKISPDLARLDVEEPSLRSASRAWRIQPYRRVSKRCIATSQDKACCAWGW